MNIKEACDKLDINYEKNIARFAGNESIYIRFLKKMIVDETYNNLKQSWREKNYEETEKYAHTLKGISANLGIDRLFKVSDSLVQNIRKKEYEKTQEYYNKLVEEYEIIKKVIANIE